MTRSERDERIEQITARYGNGDSFRKIATSLGMSEFWVRCRLREAIGLRRYRGMVEKILINRIALARGKTRKELNNAIWQLKRHRPRRYARWKVSGAPRLENPERWGKEWRCTCPSCRSPGAVFARRVGRQRSSWTWKCHCCDAEGVVKARR